MSEFLGFVLFWILMMGIIGAALKLVAHFGSKKATEQEENSKDKQDAADE